MRWLFPCGCLGSSSQARSALPLASGEYSPSATGPATTEPKAPEALTFTRSASVGIHDRPISPSLFRSVQVANGYSECLSRWLEEIAWAVDAGQIISARVVLFARKRFLQLCVE